MTIFKIIKVYSSDFVPTHFIENLFHHILIKMKLTVLTFSFNTLTTFLIFTNAHFCDLIFRVLQIIVHKI